MKMENDRTEDLGHKESLEKMKALVSHTRTCFFTTHLSEVPLQTRPMATLEVDDEGNFWFFSRVASDKNLEITDDTRVQLFYANEGRSEFMTVYGHAMISKDKERIDRLWTPMAKAWFKGGKDDPSVSLIMVLPEEAYYWDTKNNKMVSLIKIMASMVSGKEMDDGVEGTLKV